MSEQSDTRYQPPLHLLASSGLSASQLILQFEAFQSSLPMGIDAPDVIFERALSNLLSDSSLKDQSETAQLALRVQNLEQRLDTMTNVNTTGSEFEVALPTNPVRFSFLRDPNEVGVRADLHTIGDLLSGTDCQWPNPTPTNSDNVQFGCYNTIEDSSLERPLGSRTSIRVNFPVSFTVVPKVVAWLTGVDIPGSGHSGVGIEVGSILKYGFKFDLQSYVDSTIRDVGVAWVAFLPAEEDLATVSFRVEAMGPRGHHVCYTGLGEAVWRLLLLGVQSVFFVGRVRMPVIISAPVSQDNYLHWSLNGGQRGCGYWALGVVAIGQVDRKHADASLET